MRIFGKVDRPISVRSGESSSVRLINLESPFSNLRKDLEGSGLRTEGAQIMSLLKKQKTLIEVFYKYPWLNGSLLSIARTISGSGYRIGPIEPEANLDSKMERSVAQINRFLKSTYHKNDWNNIKDSLTFTNKIQLTVIYYILFGQAAWETIFDSRGGAAGFDFMYGMTVPNIDAKGNFETPAFKLYPFSAKTHDDFTSYSKPTDVVFFSNPSLLGDFVGRTYLESLFEYTVPADIYAAKAYMNMHKNHSKPAGMWVVPEMDDEDFDEFTKAVADIYKGVEHFGTSAIAVRGQVEFKEFKGASHEDMPYHEGRRFALGEIAAVTGVPTSKLGISEDIDKADLQEMKREFYEITVRPITNIIEETINEQIIWRYFGTRDLGFKFEQPDFMRAIERSAVAKRFFDVGSLNPNEIRKIFLNLPPRKGGEQYIEELRISSNVFLPQGRQPEGLKGPADDKTFRNEERGGAPRDRLPGIEQQERQPGDIGTQAAGEMPRVEKLQKISQTEFVEMMRELQTWEKFMLEVYSGQRKNRKFKFEKIPPLLAEAIEEEITTVTAGAASLGEKVRWIAIVSGVAREVISQFFDVIEELNDA